MIIFRQFNTIVLGCIGLIALIGIWYSAHLSWQEYTRLFFIFVGLGILGVKYQKMEDASGDVINRCTVVLALVVMFIITQFDPATASINFHQVFVRFNPFFILSTGFLGIALFVVVGHKRLLLFQNLDRLDRFVVVATMCMVIVSFISKFALGGKVGRDDVLSNMKMMSYLGIWLVIRYVYGQKGRDDIEQINQPILPFTIQWRYTYVVVLLCFGTVLGLGIYRMSAVFYHYQKGYQFFDDQMWAEAEVHYQTAIRLNKALQVGFVQNQLAIDMASFYFKQGRSEDAEQYVGVVRNGIFDALAAAKKVGGIYIQAGQWQKAIVTFESVLTDGKYDTKLLDGLGKAYVAVKDTKSFYSLVKKYDYVPNLMPQTYDEHVFLGNIYFAIGEYAKSLNQYNLISQFQNADGYVLYKMGKAEEHLKNYKIAMVHYQAALEQDPNFADAYYRMGVCLEALKQISDARHMYQMAIQILPNHLEGFQALSRLDGETLTE